MSFADESPQEERDLLRRAKAACDAGLQADWSPITGRLIQSLEGRIEEVRLLKAERQQLRELVERMRDDEKSLRAEVERLKALVPPKAIESKQFVCWAVYGHNEKQHGTYSHLADALKAATSNGWTVAAVWWASPDEAQELSTPASEAPRPSQEEAPATGSAGADNARVVHGWGCRHRSALKPCTIFPVHAYESACEWARAYDCEVEPWYGHEPAPPATGDDTYCHVKRNNAALKQRVWTQMGQNLCVPNVAVGNPEAVAQWDLLGRDL